MGLLTPWIIQRLDHARVLYAQAVNSSAALRWSRPAYTREAKAVPMRKPWHLRALFPAESPPLKADSTGEKMLKYMHNRSVN